ncbi:unnamed protein product [Pleuronectes platessa]|uniref:Uncharacterized protein n=1 Tax=Pleuronectes platessa TaxID=8262 RepID=A0A9N7VEY5_PLEPL|nr:unnamed protein product [Pleuronectes platessa]
MSKAEKLVLSSEASVRGLTRHLLRNPLYQHFSKCPSQRSIRPEQPSADKPSPQLAAAGHKGPISSDSPARLALQVTALCDTSFVFSPRVLIRGITCSEHQETNNIFLPEKTQRETERES